MVQEFCILKCCACNFFQVHIVKKAKSWVCKLCGFKQSVIKLFGQGAAKDCRRRVQELNHAFQNKHELVNEDETWNTISNHEESATNDVLSSGEINPEAYHEYHSGQSFSKEFCGNTRKSKWSIYLDVEDDFKPTPVKKKRKWDSYADTKCENKSSSYNNNESSNSSQCLKKNSKKESYLTLERSQSDLSTPPRESLVEKLQFPPINNINSTSTASANQMLQMNSKKPNNGICLPVAQDEKTADDKPEYSSNFSSDKQMKSSGTSRLFSTLTETEDIDSILCL